jgi:hypothetical protein
MYGRETWCLTLKEGRKLRAFENRVLRKICRSKADKATGEWRRLYKEELYDLYSSPTAHAVAQLVEAGLIPNGVIGIFH